MKKKITQQAFNEWAEKYYKEAQNRISSGEMTWYTFGDKDLNCVKPDGILLINLKNGKTARSYCHDDDEWNFRTGLAVAYARYMGVEVPQVEKTYRASELIGKEIMYHGKRIFITPYGNSWCLYMVTRAGVVGFIDRDYVVFESDIREGDE